MPLQVSALSRLHHLITYLETHSHESVIDSDTHITDRRQLSEFQLHKLGRSENYYHGRTITAEELLAEMKMSGVDMSLCWQNPAATAYGTDRENNFKALLAANRYVSESADAYPSQIIPAGWTDPKALGLESALRLVEICVLEFGFPLVKMNPAQNEYPIDSPEVLTVLDRIVELGAVPAFHFGADTIYTPAEGLRKLAQRHPDHPVVAVHMGGGGAGYLQAEKLYSEARDVGLSCPNIHFPLSAKRECHMESDLIAYQSAGPPFSNNLSCGSDAPYGRQAWNFGGFRLMFEGLLNGKAHTDRRLQQHPALFSEESVAGYLGGNIAAVVVKACRTILKIHDLETTTP